MDPVLSTAQYAAELNLDLIDLDDEQNVLIYSLIMERRKVAQLQEELSIMLKRSEQNKETLLQIEQAHHKEEMAMMRKEMADLAFHMINRYVEAELLAAGTDQRLTSFCGKREQRRMDIEKVFGCDKYDDTENDIEVAMKKRRMFQKELDRDDEEKERREDEYRQNWAACFEEYEYKSKENQKYRSHYQKLLEEEQMRAASQNRPKSPTSKPFQGASRKRPLNLDKVDQPPKRESDPLPSNNPQLLQEPAKSPRPLTQKESDGEMKLRLAEKRKRSRFAPRLRKMLDTEADFEIDIPKYGNEHPDYEEGAMNRSHDPERQLDHPEQMVVYIYWSTQNPHQTGCRLI